MASDFCLKEYLDIEELVSAVNAEYEESIPLRLRLEAQLATLDYCEEYMIEIDHILPTSDQLFEDILLEVQNFFRTYIEERRTIKND